MDPRIFLLIAIALALVYYFVRAYRRGIRVAKAKEENSKPMSAVEARLAERRRQDEQRYAGVPEAILEKARGPDGLIRRKKLKNLLDKDHQRQLREERLKRQKEEEARRLKEREQQEQEEEIERQRESERQAELERKAAEREALAQEELELWQDMFETEAEGAMAADVAHEDQELLQKFITSIIEGRIVVLEELANEYRLCVEDVIRRIETLVEQERIMGVFDSRGRFVSVTMEDLEKMSSFINANGRVSVPQLTREMNNLIAD